MTSTPPQTRRMSVKRTQSDIIRETLADKIVHGLLKPGDPLDETVLAAEFGVSRTPVREALRQLETNGLAASRPHRGAVVADFTARELDDVFVVMSELEALCASFSAICLNPAEREAFACLHESGLVLVEDGDVHGYTSHNDAFHSAIYSGSHNAFLRDTTIAVRRRLSPFRHLQFEAPDRLAASHAEHGLIVQAILAHDCQTAACRMRAHILEVRRTVDAVRES